MRYSLFLLLFLSSNLFAQLAQEPTEQPTDLTKGSLDLPYRMSVSFSSTSADRYLVLRAREPIVATPQDGVRYSKGEGLGNAKVFYTLSGNSNIEIRETVASTNYYFAVFAYNIDNNTSSTCNYLTVDPLTDIIRSAGANYGSYYNSIDQNAPSLLLDLSNLVEPHTIIDYDDFDATVVNNFLARDTVNGQKVANCQYSNEFSIFSGSFDFSQQGYTREHRMPFSWIDFMNISRTDFQQTPEGTDAHALSLVEGDVNQARLNYPVSDDIVTATFNYLEFRQGRDSRNKDVAEVRDDRKGDLARAKFYMMLTYNGKYLENWGFDNLLSDSENQDWQVLFDWHVQDPVDAFEQARHEYVYSEQNNRNPFIDFPQLVDCIDFSDMTLKGPCALNVSIDENSLSDQVNLYPLPAKDAFTVTLPSGSYTWEMSIMNIQGQQMLGQFIGNGETVDVSSLQAGYYLCSFLAEGQVITKPLLIHR